MSSPLRILDANANRAREALRVLEDISRFLLDNASLSQRLKALRHDLSQLLTQALPDRLLLLSSRDTDHDVGTLISTPAEYDRPSLDSLLAANAARLTEALRSIEETLKLMGRPQNAQSAESLRYLAYSIEKDLALALKCGASPQPRLCVLLTESLCSLPWLEVATRAIDGGADILQLREKSLDGKELLRRARLLVELAATSRAKVFINDRPDIALLSNAHGVHVGQSDLPIPAIRQLCGGRLLIGVSTFSLEEALAAAADSASLCGVGPMFQTTTTLKPVIAGPRHLSRYLSDPIASRIPHLAIGGINTSNIHQLVEVGCRGVAASNAVCSNPHPERVCDSLITTLASASKSA